MNNKDQKTIKVSKIEIKIGDKILSLTPEEIQQLKQILEDTFPNITPQFWHKEYIVIPQPYYINYSIMPWPQWQITWYGTNDDTTMQIYSKS